MAQSGVALPISDMNSSPRSGVSLLLSERPSNEFLPARCVSPSTEDWESLAQAKMLSHDVRRVDTVMDLTKMDEEGSSLMRETCTRAIESSGFPFEPCDGIADGGRTPKIPVGAPACSLREILRTVRFPLYSNHHNTNLDGCERPNAFRLSDDTMTSHILHHNENKLYHAGTLTLESQVQPRMYSSRRHRSRAIAIKPTSRDEKSQEIRESTAAAEYDLSTWKMYNRIIDYRQKFPVNYHHEETPSESLIPTMNLRLDGFGANATALSESPTAPYQVQDYPEYGEVFDLDL